MTEAYEHVKHNGRTHAKQAPLMSSHLTER